MLRKLSQRINSEEKGFTLIELLVVILIIGILAAIALPAFLNQRSKAQDSSAKSLARNAQTAIETYYTDQQTYTGASKATLSAIEPEVNDPGLTAVTPTSTGKGYSLTTHSASGKDFVLARSDTGDVTRTCGTGCSW
jgi:type IV pilus assembly protein PilA